ncbi:MAG: hypothetical protein KKD17_02475 [Nanoarchaeota archaeon]|nr:hypothetical protein [Nanoarchaeota archaeon]
MHEKDGMLMFDSEGQVEIVLELLRRGLNGRMIITDCGRNPRVFLDEAEQDEFLRSRKMDPDHLRVVMSQRRPDRYVDPKEQNSPGAEQRFGPGTLDPVNILQYGRGGSTVRVAQRLADDSYPVRIPFAMKVVEKTCPDEWSAMMEERIMRELKQRGRRVAEIYRREGRVLDIEMVSPTIYELANTDGRSQQELESLLEDAMDEKLMIYQDLPEILDADVVEEVKRRRVACLRPDFPGLSDEDIEHNYDCLKLIKSLHLHDDERMRKLAGIEHPSQFLDVYEEAYGWMLREERRVHARLLSDEYTRNRGVRDGKTIAFDFTPRFDIPQIDDLFLLQAGGNRLQPDTQQRLVMRSAIEQGREPWDYYATYICASPTRSYMQMAYIVDDLHSMHIWLERLHAGGMNVSAWKDPAQYVDEFSQVYVSRLAALMDEFVSYAEQAKQYAHHHGMNCVFGAPTARSMEHMAQLLTTPRKVVWLHNAAMELLGARLAGFLDRQKDAPFFKETEVLDEIEGQISDVLEAQLL